MDFEKLIRYKALDQIYGLGNHHLLDALLSQPGMAEQAGTRKIQFDASKEQFQDLEEVVFALGISKREFLESALADALLKAHQIIKEEKLFEYLEAFDQADKNSVEGLNDVDS